MAFAMLKEQIVSYMFSYFFLAWFLFSIHQEADRVDAFRQENWQEGNPAASRGDPVQPTR